MIPTRSPLPIPRATSPRPNRSEIRSRSAKLSRSSRDTTASAAPWTTQKARNRPGRVGGSFATIARPRSSRSISSMPPGPVTRASTSSKRRSRSVCIAGGFLCLSTWPPYDALNIDGEALASRRHHTLHCISRPRAVTGGAAHRDVRPSLVQPRLPRRHLHRLLVPAQALEAAGRPNGQAPCRRPGVLRRPRCHFRWPLRLRPVLQSRRLPPPPDRDFEALGRRHVVPRRRDRHFARHFLFRAQAEAQLAPNPRLCRLLRPVRPVVRADRQLHPLGAVGRADDGAVGDPLPGVQPARPARARPAAPSKPALRGRARRHRPVLHPWLHVLEDQGPLRSGQARRRVPLLLRLLPFRDRVYPRAR